jgi:hypothetical protein
MGRLQNIKHDWLQKDICKNIVWIMERLLRQFSVIHLLDYPWQWLLNNIEHINVTTAFLYGNLEETFYMEQSEGSITKGEGNKIYILSKAIYALKQALRSWNQRIHAAFLIHGFWQAKLEPRIYYMVAKNYIIIVAVYVDDLILLVSKTAQKEKPKGRYQRRIQDEESWGGNLDIASVARKKPESTLDQQQYTQEVLEKFKISKENQLGHQ